MRKLLFALAALVPLTLHAADKPKNIIYVISDGMGPVYTTGYRYFADDKSTPEIEKTVFDRLHVGSASTYPAAVSGVVTDSAAAATALSTGVKSYNGAIGVDVDKKTVPTILQMAKQKGMKTGVAVTSQVNHATPAAFITHNESRKNYNEIAESYFDQRIDGKFTADVILGGGTQYFQREDRDLVGEFIGAGYEYLNNINDLPAIQPGKPLLGLFAPVGLPWALDYPQKKRLLSLTQAAVRNLENDKGFFLLVEASQVDWAGHANDVAAAMGEMADLADTLEWLEAYVDNNPDTILVVTADHSTGGMSLARERAYIWKPDFIHKLEHSPATIAQKLVFKPAGAQREKLAKELLPLEFEAEELEALKKLTAVDQQGAYSWVKSVIDRETHTGWTTGGHTAVDVPVLAKGLGAEAFVGHQDNTEIAKKLISVLP
ncbi:alkaline phosphatase [Sessilibacter corallicola]|uniref:alkaline phosphatase n=1 Tax=Sessilibacter corallicola TaxID=2904075 RepID=UPI001E5E5FA0|nr:alkaline phosphatase [Sessilibacter corallicola]MCE2027318.1 alkaline phosphatase [Sessilibacter corallicola]